MDKYVLENLNLYEAKSKNSKIIVSIPKGSKIKILDMEDEWDKASFNSYEGYVEDVLLSKSKYTKTGVNLREGSSLTSNKIMVIPKNAEVEVLGQEGNFSRIFYNNKEGYLYNYYLSDDVNNSNVIDYTYFYSDINKFVNDNKLKRSSYLLITDINNRLTYVFQAKNNVWIQIYKWTCTVGKASTPTIKGVFYVSGRKPGFGTDAYSVKYAVRIKNGYYYHSILYNASGSYVIDGRLGMALSHGCIRLETENAKWIYENVSDGTAIIIH